MFGGPPRSGVLKAIDVLTTQLFNCKEVSACPSLKRYSLLVQALALVTWRKEVSVFAFAVAETVLSPCSGG